MSESETGYPAVFWKLELGDSWDLYVGVWNFRDLDARDWLNILDMRSVELRKVSRLYIANTIDNGIIKLGSAD